MLLLWVLFNFVLNLEPLRINWRTCLANLLSSPVQGLGEASDNDYENTDSEPDYGPKQYEQLAKLRAAFGGRRKSMAKKNTRGPPPESSSKKRKHDDDEKDSEYTVTPKAKAKFVKKSRVDTQTDDEFFFLII
ncbi:hypothetical protein L1987_18928 [Smallanthus sonchifolius]|uniref:Uncharacterized protein n=1 Tax=Smallanthus sonchifolius TaxID=185202 RepID=A0ACB9J327_9ASTR|nr:hypothetical protein L1987_18928 [Smallanthus sonchifolius]